MRVGSSFKSLEGPSKPFTPEQRAAYLKRRKKRKEFWDNFEKNHPAKPAAKEPSLAEKMHDIADRIRTGQGLFDDFIEPRKDKKHAA